MTIRKTWNLWRLLILPGGFLVLFFINMKIITDAEDLVGQLRRTLLSVGIFFVWYAVIIFLIIPQKCKCPKCKQPLKLHKCSKLSASSFTGWYWSSNLKIKCHNCGNLLNNNDDEV